MKHSTSAEVADELWLCRGDLGAEFGLRSMAEAARRFSNTIGDLPIPALLAGQVLEHMVEHPAPTRSEVCYSVRSAAQRLSRLRAVG